MTLKKIMELKGFIEKDKILLMGKRSKQAMDFFHKLFKKPIVTIKDVEAMTGLSTKAANDLVRVFCENKILKEATGFQRNRIFVFQDYVNMF